MSTNNNATPSNPVVLIEGIPQEEWLLAHAGQTVTLTTKQSNGEPTSMEVEVSEDGLLGTIYSPEWKAREAEEESK